jgi:hypothetical protein
MGPGRSVSSEQEGHARPHSCASLVSFALLIAVVMETGPRYWAFPGARPWAQPIHCSPSTQTSCYFTDGDLKVTGAWSLRRPPLPLRPPLLRPLKAMGRGGGAEGGGGKRHEWRCGRREAARSSGWGRSCCQPKQPSASASARFNPQKFPSASAALGVGTQGCSIGQVNRVCAAQWLTPRCRVEAATAMLWTWCPKVTSSLMGARPSRSCLCLLDVASSRETCRPPPATSALGA